MAPNTFKEIYPPGLEGFFNCHVQFPVLLHVVLHSELP